jgi:hypothetical protein
MDLRLASILLLAAAAAAAGERRAREFDAVPGDGRDDRAALQAALDACGDGDRLVLEKGTYEIDLRPGSSVPPLLRAGPRGLTLAGNGAELLFRGYDPSRAPTAAGFRFERCDDLTVEGLTFDTDRPPWTIGRVTMAKGGRLELEVPAGLPVTADLRVAGMLGFTETGLPMGSLFDRFDPDHATTLFAPQKLRFLFRSSVRPGIARGDQVAVLHQTYGGAALDLVECDRVTVRDVTVRALPGMGLVAAGCSDVTVERFRALRRPGSLLSLTSDGIHVTSAKGTVTLTDCELEGLGDDGVNVHGHFTRVAAVEPEASAVTLEQVLPHTYARFEEGEEIALHDDRLRLRGRARVRSWERDPRLHSRHRLVLDQLPAGTARGDALTSATRDPVARLSRVRVKGNRAAGIVLQTSKATVEECLVRDCTGPGLSIRCDIDGWWESGPAREVTVRDCVFEGVNRGDGLGVAGVSVFALVGRKRPAPAGTHRGLRFERVVVRSARGPALHLGSAAEVDAIRCELTPAPGAPAVRIEECRDVRLSGNRIAGEVEQKNSEGVETR